MLEFNRNNHTGSRREFLQQTAAGLVLAGTGPVFAQTGGQQSREVFPGLIVREKEPENLEFPFSTLTSFITPNERFFVRNHFAAPEIDVRTWRLRVEGAVKRPLDLSYDAIRQMPARTVPATLECAGNNRVFLAPKQRGVGWELGAVSTAEWTGVPLSAVLAQAGIRDNAVEVILEGTDTGEVRDEPKSPGVIHFARSLPMAKAQKPEVLLAYRMNGKDLPRPHGFPLRAIVPGWFGVASIKWLRRLIVTDKPFDGYYQSLDYSIFERRNGIPSVVPLTEMQVKASISRPALFEVVPGGREFRVHGAAWTGESTVVRVEVSTNAGKSWADANLIGKQAPHCWRMWEFDWPVPAAPGKHVLMARATDSLGRTQPRERDQDRRNYMVSHVLPIEVEVR